MIQLFRKLTKRERKRQERLLQTLAKKQNKKDESDLKVKNKIVEAYQLINRKKYDASLLLFQEILALPTNQVLILLKLFSSLQ